MFTNVTLVFFLLLIPLSGFIAWAGDRIGHKTGKRRQSLFGLRPRHTAMVFTIGSGMAIAFVSFGLFWAFSESFRVVVRDGAALYQKNRRLKAENREQAVRVINLHQDAKRFVAERQNAEVARDIARDKMNEAQARLTEAEANYHRAAAGREVAQADLGRARGDLALVQRDLKAKTERVQAAVERIHVAENNVRAAEAKAAEAQQQQQVAQREAQHAKERAVQLATTADEALHMQATRLNAKTEAIRQQFDAQNKLYADLQGKTEMQRIALAHLTEELDRKRAEFDQIASDANALRRRQITYQVGEEVDRITIQAGHNVWRIEAILYSLLTTAAKKAETRGAAHGEEADRSVIVLPRTVVASAGPTEAMSNRTVTEDDAVRAAADTIRRANEDVVVVATAMTNAVAGEPVAVDFQIHRNPVVLTEGDRIAEITIEGDASRQEVADALFTFLSRDVHHKLTQAGMIPVSRGGEGEGAVVEANRVADEFTLGGEEWLQIVEKVRRAGAGAKVIAYAAKDLHAGDPVALRFEVKSRPTPPVLAVPLATARILLPHPFPRPSWPSTLAGLSVVSPSSAESSRGRRRTAWPSFTRRSSS